MRSTRVFLLIFAACGAAPPPGVDEPARDPLVGPVTAFASLDAARYACSQAGIARVDVDPPALVSDPGFRVVALAADPFDRSLVCAGGSPGEAGIVARVIDGRVAQRVRLADDLVSCVTLDPGDRTVLVGCDDGRVLALAPDTLAVRAELRRHTAPVRALALSGGLLASAGRDGNLMLGPRDAAPRVLRDHTAGIDCAAWSADGTVLASGSRDGRVRFHDRDGRLLRSTEPLRAQVLCLAALERGGFAFGTDRGDVLEIGTEPSADPVAIACVSTPVHALTSSPPDLLAGVAGGVRRVPRGPTAHRGRAQMRSGAARIRASTARPVVDSPSSSSVASIRR